MLSVAHPYLPCFCGEHGQGARRCVVVRPQVDDPSPPKDANEALLAGRDLQEFLDGETQQWLTTANPKQYDLQGR